MSSKEVLTIVRVNVHQLSHNLMRNECRWKTAKDPAKVRMVRVGIDYKDSKGQVDCVYMECCCEHQDRAEQELISTYGLTR